MSDFHLLFLGNPNNPGDIFGYLDQVPGLRISSFQSRTDKAISISRAPARTVCTDFNDLAETLHLVRAVHAIDPFDGVMAIYELFTPLAGMIRDALGISGVSRFSVHAARNKLKTRELLTQAGLSRVAYAPIDTLEMLQRFMHSVGGPVVVKPINGVASRCVYFVREPSEAADVWARGQADLDDPDWLTVSREGKLIGYMAESLVEGREYSVEAITHAGVTHVIAVVEKQVSGAIEAGHVVPPATLTSQQIAQIEAYLKRVIATIEVASGISHTEIKWTADGPEVIEINLRLAGDSISKIVELAYGNDLIRDYLQLMVHGKAPERGRAQAAGIRFFLPDHCRIEAVEHLESARALPGIQSVVIDAEPGKTIERIRSSRDRAGYAIARASSHAEVQHALAQVLDTISFVTTALPRSRDNGATVATTL